MNLLGRVLDISKALIRLKTHIVSSCFVKSWISETKWLNLLSTLIMIAVAANLFESTMVADRGHFGKIEIWLESKMHPQKILI